MKYLQTFEKYYVDGNIVYHYTSIENAISILESGKLNYRRMDIHNKYSTNSLVSNDYGFVSFTENEEYHEEDYTDIPIDVRFVFYLDKLEKDYNINTHDANIDEEEIHNSEDDLDTQHIPYYGDEMELRIYDEDIPIKNYIKEIDFSYEIENTEKLISLCDQNNIIYKEEQF